MADPRCNSRAQLQSCARPHAPVADGAWPVGQATQAAPSCTRDPVGGARLALVPGAAARRAAPRGAGAAPAAHAWSRAQTAHAAPFVPRSRRRRRAGRWRRRSSRRSRRCCTGRRRDALLPRRSGCRSRRSASGRCRFGRRRGRTPSSRSGSRRLALLAPVRAALPIPLAGLALVEQPLAAPPSPRRAAPAAALSSAAPRARRAVRRLRPPPAHVTAISSTAARPSLAPRGHAAVDDRCLVRPPRVEAQGRHVRAAALRRTAQRRWRGSNLGC